MTKLAHRKVTIDGRTFRVPTAIGKTVLVYEKHTYDHYDKKGKHSLKWADHRVWVGIVVGFARDSGEEQLEVVELQGSEDGYVITWYVPYKDDRNYIDIVEIL